MSKRKASTLTPSALLSMTFTDHEDVPGLGQCFRTAYSFDIPITDLLEFEVMAWTSKPDILRGKMVEHIKANAERTVDKDRIATLLKDYPLEFDDSSQICRVESARGYRLRALIRNNAATEIKINISSIFVDPSRKLDVKDFSIFRNSPFQVANAAMKTRRSVVRFPLDCVLSPGSVTLIDEADCFVLRESFLRCGLTNPDGLQFWRKVESEIAIQDDNEERRVLKLNLRDTKNLTSLPEDIGNLGNLTILGLWGSGIQSLPLSIGRLQNLEVLDLCDTKNLTSLPEDIGNLGNLTKLTLFGSGVVLPSSIKYALACSRLRSRAVTVSPTGNQWPIIRQNQWPIILQNAVHAFRPHRLFGFFVDHEDLPTEMEGLGPRDAIYRLLQTDSYRDSFVNMLVNRNNEDDTGI